MCQLADNSSALACCASCAFQLKLTTNVSSATTLAPRLTFVASFSCFKFSLALSRAFLSCMISKHKPSVLSSVQFKPSATPTTPRGNPTQCSPNPISPATRQRSIHCATSAVLAFCAGCCLTGEAAGVTPLVATVRFRSNQTEVEVNKDGLSFSKKGAPTQQRGSRRCVLVYLLHPLPPLPD
jgi:hypothetical protein